MCTAAVTVYNCHKTGKNWCDISKLVNTQGWCLNYAKTSIDEFPITGDKLTLLEKKNKVSLCLSDRIRMELLCPCAIRILRNLRILSCANY